MRMPAAVSDRVTAVFPRQTVGLPGFLSVSPVSAEIFFGFSPNFVDFVIDTAWFTVLNSKHQLKNIDKGVDGEKYRRSSVPVSGGQWKPRNKESVGRTLRSCDLNAGFRQ